MPWGYPRSWSWQSFRQKVSLCLCGEGCMKLAHRSVLKQIRLIQYLQNVLKYNHDDAVKIGAQIVFYIDQSKRLTLVFFWWIEGFYQTPQRMVRHCTGNASRCYHSDISEHESSANLCLFCAGSLAWNVIPSFTRASGVKEQRWWSWC